MGNRSVPIPTGRARQVEMSGLFFAVGDPDHRQADLFCHTIDLDPRSLWRALHEDRRNRNTAPDSASSLSTTAGPLISLRSAGVVVNLLGCQELTRVHLPPMRSVLRAGYANKTTKGEPMSTAIATKPNMSSKTTIQFPQTMNFLDELEALSQETARRAFSFFQQRGRGDGWDLDDWFRAEAELLRPVPIEMSESDESYTIRAEVPGFDAKNLQYSG